MIKEIELRLVDAAAPSGEIAAKDLAALATALQELATRISRDVVNTPGPGRTKQFMEELSQLRLHAVEPGSTVLRFSKGPTDKLDVDLPEQATADDRFWEIVQAMGDDTRPDWTTELIAESVGKLVNAIKAAAPTVVLASPSRRDVRIVSSAVHVETWMPTRIHPGGVMTATGRLEKVDLRSHEFRVRDDVDQTVDLKHVQSDATAAQLVGQWVVARGDGVLHESGRLVVLDNASVSRVDDPAAEYMDRRVTTLDQILASAPGPDIDGGIDLTDDEFNAFLEGGAFVNQVAAAVVDTDVFSLMYLRRANSDSRVAGWREFLTGRRVLISFQTRAEVLAGARSAQWGDRRMTETIEILDRTPTIRPDDEVVDAYAELTAACRRVGHGLQARQHTGDRWVAACAIAKQLDLLAGDGIYRDAPNLDVRS